MPPRPRAFRPQASPLESRLLLSLTDPLVDPLAPNPDDQAEVTTLEGTPTATIYGPIKETPVRGSYLGGEDNRAADAPLVVGIDATGPVKGFGQARVSGSIALGGMRVAGSPGIEGTLTVITARGTVTLRLTSPGGFEQVPVNRFTLSATVVKGTGIYRQIHRAGTATIQFGANGISTTQSPAAIGGAVALGIELKPVRR